VILSAIDPETISVRLTQKETEDKQ
jgi:regulator of extracellular matrix RemA (YlzA/DUF370 family)